MDGVKLRTTRCRVAVAVSIPATVLAMSLAGCGFEPLYADRTERGGISTDVASVRIAPIPDRTGQILRNELIDRLNPSGEPADPRFTLDVRIAVAKLELGIRKDETATHTSLRFRSTFRLRDRSSNAIVFSSRAGTVTSYNIVDSEYATIASERAARRRGLALIADSIALRVAAYFNRLRSLRRRQ